MSLRMPRYLQRLAPPRLLLVGGVVTAGFVLYGAVLAAQLWLSVRVGPEQAAAWIGDLKPFLGKLLCIIAVAYGLGRAGKFHPVWHSAYARWLEQTPWRVGRPLPLGPVLFAWRDLLPVTAIALLAHFHSGIEPAIPLSLMAFAYVVVAGFTFTVTPAKAPVPATLLAFGVPAMVLLVDHPRQALLAAVPLLGISWVGVRQSLARFPWKDDERPTGLPTQHSLRQESLGWPLDRLAPKPIEKPAAQWVGWLTGAIAAWWLFVLLWQVLLEEEPAVRAAMAAPLLRGVAIAAAGMAVLRTLCYAMGHQWPISLTGRLLTGRLILPRYDYILLAPLCVAAGGIITPLALSRLGLRVEVVAATTVGLSLATVINLGPSMRRWNLTGAYHMVRVLKNGAERPRREGASAEE